MRAFGLTGFDAPPALLDDLPAPVPEDGEVLVRVRASSVNPADAAIAGGMLREMIKHTFPVVLGRDYAGVVEQVGSGVTRYSAGDEVYGFVPHADPDVHDGSWTELIVVPQDRSIGPKRSTLDLATAGVTPLAGITAILAVDALQVSAGDTVLVVGATGGVGSFAVQLAADAGATVIAPALPEDEEYLRGLGVGEVLDRGSLPDGVDALLDLVSYAPDGFEANAAALKPGGRGASPIGAAGDGPGRINLMASPTPENLARVAELLDAGTVRVPIHDSYPLDRAGEAMQALATSHKRGKIALEVA